jgi:hypothetical protein
VLVAPKIQPDRTHETARLDRSFDLHAITFGARVLLERDGVCSPGQQAAREDAHGLAWPELPVVGAARGRAADQAQSSIARRQIGRAHRVAIHRRGVAGRLVAQGDQVLRKHPARGSRQVYPFGRQRRERRDDARVGFFDRKHHSAA